MKTEVPLGPPAAVGSSPTVGSAATVKPARPQDTSVFGVFTTELNSNMKAFCFRSEHEGA